MSHYPTSPTPVKSKDTFKKILMFMFFMDECLQQNHAQHAPYMKTECDYLNS